MQSLRKMLAKTLICSTLTAASLTALVPLDAHAQSTASLPQFLTAQGSRLRTNLTNSFILLLQTNPVQARIAVDNGGAACLARILPPARNNLGCNPAQAACARSVSAELLRGQMFALLDLRPRFEEISRLRAGSQRTLLTNQALLQIAAIELAALNVADPESFRRFSANGQTAPSAGGPLIRAQLEADCNLNAAPPSIALGLDPQNRDPFSRGFTKMTFVGVQLIQQANARADRATVCRIGGRTPGGLDLSQRDPCQQLVDVFLPI